jgi:hypothetical protein
MALVNRSAVAGQLELRREVVSVPALGGDVIVTEMTLTDRLDFDQVLRGDFKAEAEPGEPPSSPAEATPKAARSPRRSVHAMVPQLLACTVLGDGDEPLLSVDEWQAFGARNRSVAIQLANVAFRLNGFDGGANEKN